MLGNIITWTRFRRKNLDEILYIMVYYPIVVWLGKVGLGEVRLD
jgi:hypothetical protein